MPRLAYCPDRAACKTDGLDTQVNLAASQTKSTMSANADLAVLLIFLQNLVSFTFNGICNLMKEVAPGFAGEGLKAPGGISGLNGQLPAAVWHLWRTLRVCIPNTHTHCYQELGL